MAAARALGARIRQAGSEVILMAKWILLAAVLLLGFYLIRGFRRVDIGAKGLVIFLGKRTGDIRGEGFTWLPRGLARMVTFYPNERQIDIDKADYYTADRVRLSFKTTLRVKVHDIRALFEQGQGTYSPFTHPDKPHEERPEEKHIPLNKLVENTIRRSVASLTNEEVAFAGAERTLIEDRIQDGISSTVQRWGLAVLDVWLTKVTSDSKKLEEAFQAEAIASLEGQAEIAGYRAEVAKRASFHDVAAQIVERARQDGRHVDFQSALSFLASSYTSDRILDAALAKAGGTEELTQELIAIYYKMHPGLSLAVSEVNVIEIPADTGPDGSWIIGRDGHIAIDGVGVSREHARLDRRQGRWSITDLASTNGTFVNGHALKANSATPIKPGDSISFGQKVSRSFEELRAALRH